MALSAILGSLDGVPDDLKAHYREADGKFVLDVTPVDGYSLEDNKGLKSALQASRAERDDFKKKLSAFGELTPEEAKKAQQALDDMESSGLDAEGKAKAAWERKEAALTEKFQRDQEALTEQLRGMQATNDGLLIGSAIDNAAREHNGNKFLPMALRERLKVVEHEGKRVAAVVGDDGAPRYSEKAGNNGLMPVAEFVEQLKADSANEPLFNSNGTRGAGVSGTAAGRGVPGRIDQSLPPSSRRSMYRQQKGG